MDPTDQALQSFKEFTGSTDEGGARRLLSDCAWNVERAIDCFFSGRNWEEEEVMWGEQQQQPMSSNQEICRRSPWTIPPPPAPGNATNGNRRQIEEEHTPQRRSAKLDDSIQIIDEEDNDVQMVEESFRNGASKAANGSAAAPTSSDGIRDPIAPVQGVLINQSFRETYRNRERLWNSVFEQYHQDQQQPSSSSSATFPWSSHRATANGDNTSASNRPPDLGGQLVLRPPARAPLAPLSVVPLDQNDDDSNDDRHAQSQHRKALQTLFRPPVELMFQGDWDQVKALQAARQKGVWLLVNVQEASEFACAVLNRDIWSAETVREVVRSNFLFWQVYHDSSDGTRIRGYYGLSSFPAIFVVDPRTGEEVSGRLKASDSVSFLDSLTSFLDQNPTFEARDRFVREQTLCNRSEPLLHITSSPPPKYRAVTLTKKRKMSGDSEENAIGGFETNRQKAKTQAEEEEEEEQMMNRQAKKIKRVVTITDDADISDRQPFSSSQFAVTTAQNEALLDPNEWRHWLLNDDDQSKNKTAPMNGKKPSVAQMLFRLPDSQTRRVRMWMAAPLSALFSLLSSMGISPANHQLVLDYPRREFSLSPQSRRLSLESAGFGGQEVVHVDRIAP